MTKHPGGIDKCMCWDCQEWRAQWPPCPPDPPLPPKLVIDDDDWRGGLEERRMDADLAWTRQQRRWQ